MTFKQLISKYVTGNLTTYQLPDLGIIGLEEGLDSKSLRILAGLSSRENQFKIAHYFNTALYELGIPLPDRRQAAIEYAHGIADEILKGQKEIFEGTKEIVYKALHSYDFFSEEGKYLYDSIGFAMAYGLYDTLNDLREADIPWSNDKTNEQLFLETKQLLWDELKSWKDEKDK